jgi:uncharacterized protein YjbI with pentapeptide repeats
MFDDAEMRRVDLTHTNLTGAALVGADLTEANFSYSSLHGTDLSYSMLVSALFNEVDLRDANLRQCELALAVLNGVSLAGADLTNAQLSRTVLSRCHDLHHAAGLEELRHLHPSSIDLETLRHCLPGLSNAFLEAFGAEPSEIDALRDLRVPGRLPAY